LLNDEWHVKITDFGEAKVIGTAPGARSGSFVGTAEYMSPELVNDRSSYLASDLWALGTHPLHELTQTAFNITFAKLHCQRFILQVYSICNTKSAAHIQFSKLREQIWLSFTFFRTIIS
jgi:serine/threonine protein kinase